MRYELDNFHRDIPDDELLADLQRVAEEIGRESVTTRTYNERGRFHSQTLMTRFGGWTAACTKAELKMTIHRNISTDALFRNLEDVWIRLGRQPRHREVVKPLSSYSKATYAERFGSWHNALNAFITYINNEKDPASDDVEENLNDGLIIRQLGPRTVNDRLRFIVMRRDNFKCVVCGRAPANDPTITLAVDHIKAWSKGGPTVLENLQTLCTKCNSGKSDLEFTNAPTIEVQNVEA